MNIYNEFANALKEDKYGHDIETFADVTNYLLERGVIVRGDTELETKLYDYYATFNQHIESFFAIMRVQVYHNEEQQSIRIFAPASKTPYEVDGREVTNNFTYKLSSEESAYLLSLAIIYDQKLRSGTVMDDYSVEVEQEEFNTSLASNLGYVPTDNKTERKEALKTLKKLKVVDFSDNVFEDIDKVLIIRKHIKDLVRDSMISPYTKDENNENQEINNN